MAPTSMSLRPVSVTFGVPSIRIRLVRPVCPGCALTLHAAREMSQGSRFLAGCVRLSLLAMLVVSGEIIRTRN